MKISVVTPRFAFSGVPLAQIRFAKAWARAGHEVDLMIGYLEPGLTMPDTSGINLIVLGKPKTRSMLLPLVRYLKTVKPDIVFTAEDHLNALALLAAIIARSRAKISGSSRVTPFDTYSNKPLTKRWFLKQVMRAVSPRANAQTCVSHDMVAQYRQVFRDPRHVCVYNIVDDQLARSRMAEMVDDPWLTDKQWPTLVAAGRLAPWKGFGDLIAAAALLRDRGREANVLILGEGALRGELQAQIDALGLAARVRLAGHVDNPLKYFARSDVFVLSSLVEGLPNVLVEAMLAGCTPVSTDCPTGPREVLDNGRYGHLVPVNDPRALADAIEEALDRPVDPALLAEAIKPFQEDAVLSRHLEVLCLEQRIPHVSERQT